MRVTFEELKGKHEQVLQLLQIAEEALELYAPTDEWEFYCDCCADGSTPLEQDHGKKAREALAKLKESK